MMKRAIVIGASSGIGKELAIVLSQNGFAIGLMARRIDLLHELSGHLPNRAFSRQADISDYPQAMAILENLIEEMGGVDLIVISSGTGFINPDLDWAKEKETPDVNVIGFTTMANVAFRHFVKAGRGHLVGISSIVAIRGSGGAPAYSASKPSCRTTWKASGSAPEGQACPSWSPTYSRDLSTRPWRRGRGSSG
jgi:short-subunit dehydrogenase